ncbi:MAG: F0F1 ATP synthase subunit epsilon [SAR324 cluster bacterium]|nr:F0F1 ATP synthase subunit epsilon [SAR324 cluster bacterium]
MSLKLEIVTPQKKIIEEEAIDFVTLPGIEGELGILSEHVPLMTTLDTGVLIYQKGAQRHATAIHWGYAQIENNRVTILAEMAENAEDIDLTRLEIAEKKAKEALSGQFGEDDTEIQRHRKYEAKLSRALVRQAAARMK